MIRSFHGQYGFLSNFWPSPILYNGTIWPTVEHLYQACKVGNQPPAEVAALASPGEAKKWGRRVPLRPDWEDVKVKVMLFCLRMKFAQPGLREQLLATRPHELTEGNTWHDNVWGDCACPKCRGTMGNNLLGRLLTIAREEAASSLDHMFWQF